MVTFSVKKLYAVFVVLIMLVNTAGFYLYYPFALQAIRKEMKALLKTLPDEKLDFFILDENAFRKARVEAHEIKLDGRMYDIARIEIRGGFYHVYCLHDQKEDSLISFLGYVLGKPFKSDPFPKVIQQFLGLVFILPSTIVIKSFHWVVATFDLKPVHAYTDVDSATPFVPPEIYS